MIQDIIYLLTAIR